MWSGFKEFVKGFLNCHPFYSFFELFSCRRLRSCKLSGSGETYRWRCSSHSSATYPDVFQHHLSGDFGHRLLRPRLQVDVSGPGIVIDGGLCQFRPRCKELVERLLDGDLLSSALSLLLSRIDAFGHIAQNHQCLTPCGFRRIQIGTPKRNTLRSAIYLPFDNVCF